MTKKHNLIKMSIQFFAAALLLGLMAIILFFTIPAPFSAAVSLVIFLIYLVLTVAFYFLYFRPILAMKDKYLLFSHGKIYEELFEDRYMLFPEHRLVMDHIYKLLNKQDAINLTKRQAEYLALQNQINPHFLYNTLEAIRGDALSEGLVSIAKTTESLASFFRYTINDMGNLVPLESEIENSENYFIIQQYRFGDKLKMNVQIPENEPELYQLLVPKLSLQPIIENAIFHGLEQITGEGIITISFETTVSRLFINITDNGIGIDSLTLKKLNNALEQVGITDTTENSSKGNGIALKNVSRRIKLLFGDQYGIHIFSTPDYGTDVRICLPKLSQRMHPQLDRH